MAGFLTSSLVGAQTTYRWVDSVSGRTAISDKPLPPSSA
ncbi:MAG: DUF4124 domain-containing protein [Betaproteobacteria bacterium]|nr:DUF4124 domain-containing protein [Betaproteobacteria bacterium]